MASILKCRGCKEDLGQIIMGRLEFDFFPKVDHDKETKYWLLRSDAAYYHPSINCMWKRRSRPRDVNANRNTKLDEEMESMKKTSLKTCLS